MNDLILAGKIGKPHGIKGEVTLHLYVDADLENITSVFIETSDCPVPYLVEHTRFLPNKTIIKFKNISSVNDAKKLTNKNFYIEKKYIIQNNQQEWVGFSVIDINKNIVIGKITDWIVQNNLEWMVVTSQDNKEILLPFNDELIERVNEANRVIFYKAIDGMY
ncbi:MAG: ribosome maturation factor RimM [Bacteroidia bacterium]